LSQLHLGKKGKKGEDGSASSQTERNWEYPRQKKGPVAKKASLEKLKEKQRKKKQQSIHDPSEEEDEDWEIAPNQGELDELAGEGEINELNGLGDGEFEYIRKNLLIDTGASICGTPKEDIGDEKIYPPEGQSEFSTANAQTISNEGTVEMRATFQNGLENKMKFKVLKIKRMIAAGSALVKTGHMLVFGDDKYGNYILHKETGKYIQMYERGGVYVVPMWIKRKKEAGFTRPPQ
jgi:hypothetical protein